MTVSFSPGRVASVLALIVLCFALACAAIPRERRGLWDRRIVWNPGIAKAIAYDVAEPIYGFWQVNLQRPFRVSDSNGVWIVKGRTYHFGAGGGVIVAIDATNGRVAYVTHGR